MNIAFGCQKTLPRLMLTHSKLDGLVVLVAAEQGAQGPLNTQHYCSLLPAGARWTNLFLPVLLLSLITPSC